MTENRAPSQADGADGRGASGRPAVSIVIPLFNKEHQIVSTLQSVFDQDFTDFEVVVVNDGSTDGSEGAIQPFLDRIRYIPQANRGPSIARNVAIAASRGQYIAFLDADDVWLPGKLRQQVEFMDAHPDVMWCGANLTFEHVSPGAPPTAIPIPADGPEWVVFDDWFAANTDRIATATPAVMLCREVLDAAGLFDPAIPAGQDADLWIRIALKYPRYGYCYRPLVHVRNDLSGSVSGGGLRKCRSMLAYLRKHVARAGDGSWPALAAYVQAKMRALVKLALSQGFSPLAREVLRETPKSWRDGQWRRYRLLSLLPSWLLRGAIGVRRWVKRGPGRR